MKIAFDTTAANRVLQVAKARQLPKAAVKAMAGSEAKGLFAVPSAPVIQQHVSNMKRLFAQQAPHVGQDVAQASDQGLAKIVAGERQFLRAAPQGAIFQNQPAHRVFSQTARAMGEAPPVLSGANKKMLEAVTKGHELAETQTRAGISMKGFGHNSPDVMLREHNMVATLPPEHQPVKELLQKARAPLEGNLLQHYGINYGEGPRFSRHARKHLTKMMEAGAQKHIDAVFPKMAALAARWW